MKVSVLEAGSDAWVHCTLPPAPTAGVVQFHPAGAASETKVVVSGSVSDKVALPAGSGPPLVTVMV